MITVSEEQHPKSNLTSRYWCSEHVLGATHKILPFINALDLGQFVNIFTDGLSPIVNVYKRSDASLDQSSLVTRSELRRMYSNSSRVYT